MSIFKKKGKPEETFGVEKADVDKLKETFLSFVCPGCGKKTMLTGAYLLSGEPLKCFGCGKGFQKDEFYKMLKRVET